MYAVVETGGKQYKVAVGDTVMVEHLESQVGDTIALDRVLMVSDGEAVQIGRPFVEGAHVSAEVVEHGRGKKVIVFKYRPKQRYRRKRGHRQMYTRLSITGIQAQAQ
jgi:large subunit ribosomal protein L21